MKRQAIALSYEDIILLINEWNQTVREDVGSHRSQKVQFNIINKTPECSDTWEFEK